MKTALCIGGASTLFDDLANLPIAFDGVVACNDAGTVWAHGLDAWVSLHPDKFGSWAEKRKKAGYPPAKLMFGHVAGSSNVTVTPYQFPGQPGSGSSGLYTAKVAMVDLGFDRVVFAGVPLTDKPHFFDRKPWGAPKSFRSSWLSLPDDLRARMRSMSGWTRVLLGSPHDWVDEK